jgi:hypothetical protein
MCLSTPWKKPLVGLGHEGGARNFSLLLFLVATLFRGEEESVLNSYEEASLARLFLRSFLTVAMRAKVCNFFLRWFLWSLAVHYHVLKGLF